MKMQYAYDKDEKKIELSIKLEIENKPFHELGNFLVDMNVVLSFCDFIESSRPIPRTLLPMWSNMYRMNRASRLLTSGTKCRIRKISEGSIVIVIGGIGALAAIVVPLITYYMQKRDIERSQMITFNLELSNESDVSYIRKTIDDLKPYNNFNEENMKLLINRLNANGYQIKCVGNDIFAISKVLNNYIGHISNTVHRISMY